jgi:dolichol-phosphate mannosyltransferase
MSEGPELSIVLPVHNEAESLPVLWRELDAVLARIDRPVEIVIVDDGSTDGSVDIAGALTRTDSRIRLVRLEDNSGLTAAFRAGFDVVRGSIVVTMDTDLQNDPADLPALLKALDGYDAVVGWRQRRDDPPIKRLSSRIGNGVRNRLTHDFVHDSASSFRVMRRVCLEAIPPYSGMHRFVPTLLRLAGHRVREVPVRHRPRRFGRSHFGVWNRALRGLADVFAVRWMMRRRIRYSVARDETDSIPPDVSGR